ncbi:MAG TPA: SRPBCC family protein [Bryobacteraceae bacterium]|nr:SRPBCC family protein [Bryobacteraceae bacterium]
MLTAAAIILILLAALLAFAATRPDHFRVERSISIDAPTAKIYPFIADFHSWRAWSPWENLDPDLKRSYSGPPAGERAVYEWQGRKAGTGRMEIQHASPDWHLLIQLDFIKPFEGHNTAEFTLTPTASATTVNWAMYGPNRFIGKLMSVFMSMDKYLGRQFEQGLRNLKSAVEK